MNDRFMEMALEVAKQGVARGQEPFAALVARDGKVLGRAHSTVRRDGDPTAVAEVNAIRQTSAILQNASLEGCVIYCTCEPGLLGASAILAANVSGLVFGAGRKDAAALGWDGQALPSSCFSPHFTSHGGVLWEACFETMRIGLSLSLQDAQPQ